MVRPWEAARYGVVSLWEMIDFAAHEFLELSQHVSLFAAKCNGAIANATCRETVLEQVRRIYLPCKKMGLDSAVAQIERIRDIVNTGACTPSDYEAR